MNKGQYNKSNNGISARRFSLLEIYRDIIDEVFDFDSVDKYKLKSNVEGWEFNANINGELIPIYIYVQDTNIDRFSIAPKFRKVKLISNFGFEIGESRMTSQYAKSSYKDYIKILATVDEALDEYISKIHPEIITFFSESKHGGQAADSQKDNVYFKAIDRNKPSGYEIDTIFDKVDKKLGIMLYRKDILK
jgi:hypothetical protein